ncbi:hypothetical protein E4T56_gene18499 [Termitomyces sp. T112]|nr:hypothetical protein E4T56_gene18499 [Termitomyces sp. T112]
MIIFSGELDKDPKYINYPIPPCEQHKRVVALRKLIARGIPSILWAEDAMRYAHRVPTCLFDQQILVPDHLLPEAAAVLQEGDYCPTGHSAFSLEDMPGPFFGTSPYPKGIRLKHRDVPEDHPYKLEPIPTWILLLPQSYFGFSVDSTERYQSLELGPSLSPLNAGILVPKYHTFLEGLIRFMMDPPTGLDHPHNRALMKYKVFVEYLVTYRVEYREEEELPPLGQMYPIEHEILEELQTNDARWYIDTLFKQRVFPFFEHIREYRAEHKVISSWNFNIVNQSHASLPLRVENRQYRSYSTLSVAAKLNRVHMENVASAGIPRSRLQVNVGKVILPGFRKLLRRPML